MKPPSRAATWAAYAWASRGWRARWYAFWAVVAELFRF